MGLFDDDEGDGTSSTGAPGTGLLGGGLPTLASQATVVIQAPVGTTFESIPDPYQAPLSDGDLSPQEEKDLEACRAGMDNLHRAFWVAGKSLETMLSGNLHRTSGYPNFADFVWVNWEISESQAHRLMDEWRMGEELAKLGWKPRESQVRELTALAKQASDQTAVAVYDAVARNVDRVTAKLLKEVVQQLPPIQADASPTDVRQLVSTAIHAPRDSGDIASTTSLGKQNSPIGESDAQASDGKDEAADSDDIQRLTATLAYLSEAQKTITRPAVRRALDEHPDIAGHLVGDIEQALNKIGRAIAVRRPAASTRK